MTPPISKFKATVTDSNDEVIETIEWEQHGPGMWLAAETLGRLLAPTRGGHTPDATTIVLERA